MHHPYVYVEDLEGEIQVPEDGILSRTIHNGERSKIILFGFGAGQQLSAHAAPFPATLFFRKRRS